MAPSVGRAWVWALYLGAYAFPGVGSTLVWLAAGGVAGAEPLGAHYLRALRQQLALTLAVAFIQGGVVVVLASGFPWDPQAAHALRSAVFMAGLQASLGLWLVTGMVGPLGELAAPRRRAGTVYYGPSVRPGAPEEPASRGLSRAEAPREAGEVEEGAPREVSVRIRPEPGWGARVLAVANTRPVRVVG